MITFALMIAFAFAVVFGTVFLFLRTPPGWTKVFLGIAWVSALAFPIGAVLHNVVEAVFEVEEPVFFLIAVIGAPLGVLVGLSGAAITAWIGRNRPRSA